MPRHGRTLIGEALLLNLLVTTVLVILILVIGLRIIVTTMEADLLEEADRTSGEISKLLAEPLYNFDESQAVRVADAYLSSRRIAGVLLTSTASGSLVEFHTSPGQDAFAQRTRVIEYRNLVVGSITLWFDGEEIWATRYRLLLFSGLVVVSFVLANLVASRFLLRNRLVNALDGVWRGLEAVGNGVYDHDIPHSPYRDVNELVHLVKAMATKVRTQNTSLVELNANLEEKVAERTREIEDRNFILERALTDLEKAQENLMNSDRMATVGKLVSGVAHEINTPVGVAITASSYLANLSTDVGMEETRGSLTKRRFTTFLAAVQDTAAIITTNLERAAVLIDSFKQLSMDHHTDERRSFDLSRHLEDLVHSLEVAWKERPLALDQDIEPGVIILSYPAAFSQIVSNLVMNSLTHGFAPDQAGIMGIRLARDNAFLVLEYRDNGAGMDARTASHIYEPFFTTRRSKGNSGLGMNIVHNLVINRLGGTIDLETGPGAGVLFRIRVPLA